MDGANRNGGGLRDVSLDDRYDLAKPVVLLSGVQALLRLAMRQHAADLARGWSTAGYVSGYRGSPLGGLDTEASRAAAALKAAEIVFEPGLNEDLSTTAIWGAQQAHLRGKGRFDGVFGMLYGKGPGIDRSGDALRHANLAGAAGKGGVLIAMGDDHTCESSTTCHQSDFALMDAQIPVLHPAGPQEVLDFGLIGWGLSRFTGCWVGLKCVKDTVESTTVVECRPDRIRLIEPDLAGPPQGRNIILGETPQQQEARLLEWRVPAIAPFARANGLDQRRIGRAGARLGVAAAGKSWLDVLEALALLGVSEADAERLGFSVYKIGLAWPLDDLGLREFAKGLETLLVVEEKRAFIEAQAKQALYAAPDRPAVIGKTDRDGKPLLQAKLDLDPVAIACAIGAELARIAPDDTRLAQRLGELRRIVAAGPGESLAERLPYFCAGCPHNSSTKLPEGARGGAGIGCHYMVQWMDRDTVGYTHMGAEGANWIGESKFTDEPHLFQNIGDGTYNHSGLMAIRAAVAAGAQMTYKLLYNDAVAMTGGQLNDGGLTPQKAARELLAAGVSALKVVVDEKEALDRRGFPPGAEILPRERLEQAQEALRQTPGVSALLYVQTCAAEKRRRRKRGAAPDPDQRVMINELVCEGCGDCGLASNCVAIAPLETEFGRKRRIDQSACNKDFSCLDGFCPSFVTVRGATPRRGAGAEVDLGGLPEPDPPAIDGAHNVLITGVGGTGVVTIGALLGMAAHLEGKGVGYLEMAGLAQKGGAVLIHCRIAETPAEVSAIRVPPGQADALIGGDLVVSGGAKALSLLGEGRTRALVNAQETITGAFTRDTEFALPGAALRTAIEARVGPGRAEFIEATRIAERAMGDSIFANMVALGAAWQRGLLPLGREAIRRAIGLNGVAVDANLRAFAIGRWAAHRPEAAAELLDPPPLALGLDAFVERRAAFLVDYQDAAWAERYRAGVARTREAEAAAAPGSERLSRAVAAGLYKLMSYKDEYEVARLHAEHAERMAAERFDGARRLTFHLAPPLISRPGRDGRPKKRAIGPWVLPLFRLLRHGKRLRGGRFDLFGRGAERRRERAMIEAYERDIAEIAARLTSDRLDLAVEIAEWPLSVRGFGPVKAANAEAAERRRQGLLTRLAKDPATTLA